MLKFINNIYIDINNDIISILTDNKQCVILSRTESGQGILIYSNNIHIVKSIIELPSLEIIGITKYANPNYSIINPINNFIIEEKETDTYYFSKSSKSSLVSILYKRSFVCKEISNIITKYTKEMINMSLLEINELLCKNGLSKYRFISYEDFRFNLTDKKYTFYDEVIIKNIGHYYIWVKNKMYKRPKINIIQYDIEKISKKDMWTRIFAHNNKYIYLFTISIHTIITDNGPIIYMISTYPGKCFVNLYSVKKLIIEFIEWLNNVTSNNHTINLIGYMTNLFGFPLLKSNWPTNSYWSFMGDEYTIISNRGSKVIMVDIANFSCGMSINEYCYYWENKNITYPKDLITISKAMSNIDYFIKLSEKNVKILHCAVNKHISVFNMILSPLPMLSFSCIEDMFFTNIMYNNSKNLGTDIYYPINYDLSNFIYESIRFKSIKSIDVKSIYPYNKYRLNSIFDIIINGKYPLGKPFYSSNIPNNKRLYIALCKVTIKKTTKIPIIFFEDSIENNTFNIVLTSIDINLVRRIGGYIIQELYILQWDIFTNIKKCTIETIDNINKINIEQTKRLIDKIINLNDLSFDCNINNNISQQMLVFLAFAVSYCRCEIHHLIELIDSHFLSEYVVKHNYKEIWIKKNSNKDIIKKLSCKMIKCI
nr:EEv maturation protein [Wadden Sea poxvirus]